MKLHRKRIVSRVQTSSSFQLQIFPRIFLPLPFRGTHKIPAVCGVKPPFPRDKSSKRGEGGSRRSHRRPLLTRYSRPPTQSFSLDSWSYLIEARTRRGRGGKTHNFLATSYRVGIGIRSTEEKETEFRRKPGDWRARLPPRLMIIAETRRYPFVFFFSPSLFLSFFLLLAAALKTTNFRRTEHYSGNNSWIQMLVDNKT